jgi:hypothetical protein
VEDLREISVVSAAERGLEFHIVGHVDEKKGGIDNLHGDAGFVHVR